MKTSSKSASLLPSGPLLDFILDKANSYVEPQRKGTPRGEKIGFPLKKYVATLYVGLTKVTLKKIAEVVGGEFDFSYGVLRKWDSETDFREEAVKHSFHFAAILAKHLSNNDFDKVKDCAPFVGGIVLSRLLYYRENLTNNVSAKMEMARDSRTTIDDKTNSDWLLCDEIERFINYAQGRLQNQAAQDKLDLKLLIEEYYFRMVNRHSSKKSISGQDKEDVFCLISAFKKYMFMIENEETKRYKAELDKITKRLKN